MQQIILFILRNRIFLFFLTLLCLAFFLTIQSRSYHKSKFINSAYFVTGTLYDARHKVSLYFNLKTENDRLTQENNRLKSLLFNMERPIDSTFIKQSDSLNRYQFTAAHIIKNSYSYSQNILLVDKGQVAGVTQDLGVVTSQGVVGIIDQVSAQYATVLSILNTRSHISANLKKTNHYGSLTWDGQNPQIVQLIDIPKIAPLAIGDTITTSGHSLIFPKGILIGVVKNFKLDKTGNYYTTDVQLFNDMTRIDHVYIITNREKTEIRQLLNE